MVKNECRFPCASKIFAIIDQVDQGSTKYLYIIIYTNNYTYPKYRYAVASAFRSEYILKADCLAINK